MSLKEESLREETVIKNQTAQSCKPIELLQICNTALKHDPNHRSVRAVSIGVQAYE